MTPALVRWSLCASLVVLGCALPFTAEASQNYPGSVELHLQLDYKLDCPLCHTARNGGKGTAQTPFGREIYRLGARGKNASGMLTALDDYDRFRYSVDGDSAPDVQELRDGTDPNKDDVTGEGGGGGGVIPPGLENVPLPQTGCSVTYRREGSGDDLAETLSAFGLASVSMIALRLAGRGRRRAL